MAHHGRKATLLIVVVALALAALATAPLGASASSLSMGHAKHVALKKMKHMQRQLKSQGAQDSGVRGCWQEGVGVGCLGMVSGKDSFLRWQCAVPMTIRPRATASAAKRVAVKFTDPMCSF